MSPHPNYPNDAAPSSSAFSVHGTGDAAFAIPPPSHDGPSLHMVQGDSWFCVVRGSLYHSVNAVCMVPGSVGASPMPEPSTLCAWIFNRHRRSRSNTSAPVWSMDAQNLKPVALVRSTRGDKEDAVHRPTSDGRRSLMEVIRERDAR